MRTVYLYLRDFAGLVWLIFCVLFVFYGTTAR